MNVPTPVELVLMQFACQVRMSLMSLLVKSISRVVQKPLKYFNGTAVSTSFVLPAAGVFPVILILDLNDSDITMSVVEHKKHTSTTSTIIQRYSY